MKSNDVSAHLRTRLALTWRRRCSRSRRRRFRTSTRSTICSAAGERLVSRHYEVSVTTAARRHSRIGIGTGLTTANRSDDAVVDLMTGAPLKYTVTGRAIEIQLARPVPADGGQARLRITKTYKDVKDYRRDGDGLVFDRPIPHPPCGDPAAGRLSAHRVQRPVAGARRSRRPHPCQLHASGARRGGAGPQGAGPARRSATRRSRDR